MKTPVDLDSLTELVRGVTLEPVLFSYGGLQLLVNAVEELRELHEDKLKNVQALAERDEARARVAELEGRRFRIMAPRPPGVPSSVPWAFVAPYEGQAMENHDQSLEELNRRGGLCALELVAIIENRRWRDIKNISDDETAAVFARAWDAFRFGGSRAELDAARKVVEAARCFIFNDGIEDADHVQSIAATVALYDAATEPKKEC